MTPDDGTPLDSFHVASARANASGSISQSTPIVSQTRGSYMVQPRCWRPPNSQLRSFEVTRFLNPISDTAFAPEAADADLSAPTTFTLRESGRPFAPEGN